MEGKSRVEMPGASPESTSAEQSQPSTKRSRTESGPTSIESESTNEGILILEQPDNNIREESQPWDPSLPLGSGYVTPAPGLLVPQSAVYGHQDLFSYGEMFPMCLWWGTSQDATKQELNVARQRVFQDALESFKSLSLK